MREPSRRHSGEARTKRVNVEKETKPNSAKQFNRKQKPRRNYSHECRRTLIINWTNFHWTGFHSFPDGTKSSNARPPFNNEAYSAFKRGNVVKGILCPSLTNSFRSRSLERSYLTYSHRQRQKSLLIVNIVDLVLKIVLAICWLYRQSPNVVSVINVPLTIHFYSMTSKWKRADNDW